MGQHAHLLSKINVGPATTSLAAHTHNLSNHIHTIQTPGLDAGKTATGGLHNHGLRVHKRYDDDRDPAFPARVGRGRMVTTDTLGHPFFTDEDPSSQRFGNPGDPDYVRADGSHAHTVGPTAGPVKDVTGPALAPQGSETHTHPFSATIDPAGSPTYNVRGGAAYDWPTELQVTLDGTDVTNDVLAVLKSRLGWGSQPKLGNGTGSHPFVKEGTGSIDLLTIATSHNIDMSREQHSLTLSVKGGGGKVIYNLYVE
jgi:hypothetical protein